MIDLDKVAPETVLLHPRFDHISHNEMPAPDAGKLVRVVFKKPYTKVHPRTAREERLASVQFPILGSRMIRPEELFLESDEPAAWMRLAEMSRLCVDDLEEQLADWRVRREAWAAGFPYVDPE